MSDPSACRRGCGGIPMAALALAMVLGAGAGAAREISGSLSYPERIAMPDSAEFAVEARDVAGRIVAGIRQPIEGRQVPFDFVLPDAPDTPLTLFGAVFAGGEALRVTDALAVPAGREDVDLGAIRLHPHLPLGFATTLRCGGQQLQLGFFEEEARLRVGRVVHRLQSDPAASGARYASDADPGTWVWTRGDRAMVGLAGETLPECVPVAAAAFLPLSAAETAEGQGLRLTLDRSRLELRQGSRVFLDVPTPAPEPVVGALGEIAGYRFAPPDAGIAVTVFDRLCTLPGGLPQPLAVVIEHGGRPQEACGGDPLALLADGTWRIAALEGKAVDGSRGLTIGFGDGRVFGSSGCNRYSGGLSVSATGLAVGGIAATRMGCAPDRMEMEARFHRLLGRVAGFTLDADGVLELRDAAGTVLIAARR